MSNVAENLPKMTQELSRAVRIMTETPADDLALASLLDWDDLEEAPRVWQSQDLAEVLRHQMATAIDFDLFEAAEPLPKRAAAHAGRPQDGADDTGEWRGTFGELFDNPKAPLALLERTKEFAKACKQNADGRVPEEIAIVLYYLSILIARMRHAARITHLDDTQVAVGVRTLLSRGWLDDRSRRLLCEGLRLIDGTV